MSEAEASETIVHVRNEIGRRRNPTQTAQRNILVAALAFLKSLILEKVPTSGDEWDFDEWSSILWELYVAAVTPSRRRVGSFLE